MGLTLRHGSGTTDFTTRMFLTHGITPTGIPIGTIRPIGGMAPAAGGDITTTIQVHLDTSSPAPTTEEIREAIACHQEVSAIQAADDNSATAATAVPTPPSVEAPSQVVEDHLRSVADHQAAVPPVPATATAQVTDQAAAPASETTPHREGRLLSVAAFRSTSPLAVAAVAADTAQEAA